MVMKRNKKVGLCMAYKGTNYGQLLQAYATQKIIEDFGFRTEIIEFKSGAKKELLPYYATFHVAMKKIFHKFRLNKRKQNELDEIHKINVNERQRVAEDFRKRNMHDFVKCDGIDQLKEKSTEYFAVVVGSDQVWLPDISVTNFFTLRFAAPDVVRISYATSMGVQSYPNYAKKPAAEFWKKIDYLSVREEQAKNVIQSICNVPVEVVADPTYLFTTEQWMEMIPSEKVIEDKYILCYFLGGDIDIKNYAKKFSKEKKIRLVSIMSDESESDDTTYADEVLYGKTPEEFINLIRNAEYILTDSFHGVAFSVINQKQFYVFYRKRIDTKESRNSRIDNIVRIWGLQNRLINNPKSAEIGDSRIDYTKVNEKRMDFRENSLKFLANALNVEEKQYAKDIV